MNSVPSKAPRIRLDPAQYRALRQRVLERDRWRCQSCGTMKNLQVHHLQFRSHSGDDDETNLITLCHECHRLAHADHGNGRAFRAIRILDKIDQKKK